MQKKREKNCTPHRLCLPAFIWPESLLFYCTTAIVLLFSTPCTLKGNQTPTIAVIPFTIFSGNDVSRLGKEYAALLTDKLAGRDKATIIYIDNLYTDFALTSSAQEKAIAAGAGVKADYVLFGTVTEFEKSWYVDIKMIPLTKKGEPLTCVFQCMKQNDIALRIIQFSQEINEKLLNNSPVLQVQQMAAPDTTALDTAQREIPDTARLKSQTTSRERIGRQQAEFEHLWESQNLSSQFNAFTVCDIDRDARNELVACTDTSIMVFIWQQGLLLKVNSIESVKDVQIISVDAANLNGNGRPEIFITALDKSLTQVQSFVVEYTKNSFFLLARELPYFFRAVPGPDSSTIILAQEYTPAGLTNSPISILTWNGITYTLARKLKFYTPCSVLGTTAILTHPGEEPQIYGFINGKNNLNLFDKQCPGGQNLPQTYGESTLFMRVTNKISPIENRFFLPLRLIAADFDRNGSFKFAGIRNLTLRDDAIKATGIHNESYVELVRCSGSAATVGWKTETMNGNIADIAWADFDNDSRNELILLRTKDEYTGYQLKTQSVFTSFSPSNR
ncbi:MAG: VCBS repeat-containing protein [Chitinivibrionales bacterium]|nr:VCBS repeat-containing protein [Chitinivibrionales bacterium]